MRQDWSHHSNPDHPAIPAYRYQTPRSRPPAGRRTRRGTSGPGAPDQEPCPAAGALKVDNQILDGRRDPGGGRVRSRAEDRDPPAGVLDDCEQLHPRPATRVNVSGKSHARRASAWAQEVRPYAASPLGCRIIAGLRQDLPDGGRGRLHTRREQFPLRVSTGQRR